MSHHPATSMKRKYVPFVSFILFPVSILLLSVSCQYDYSSPLPGLVDIRLHTISDSGRIAFRALKTFVLKITRATAFRHDHAVKNQTVIYNTLDFHAEDSSLVVGQADIPPGDYLGVLMLIQPGPSVILDGYRNISVSTLPDFDPTLSFIKSFKINEQKTTRIVLTINLDSSLVKRADTFLFKPYYYISSIHYE